MFANRIVQQWWWWLVALVSHRGRIWELQWISPNEIYSAADRARMQPKRARARPNVCRAAATAATETFLPRGARLRTSTELLLFQGILYTLSLATRRVQRQHRTCVAVCVQRNTGNSITHTNGRHLQEKWANA